MDSTSPLLRSTSFRLSLPNHALSVTEPPRRPTRPFTPRCVGSASWAQRPENPAVWAPTCDTRSSELVDTGSL